MRKWGERDNITEIGKIGIKSKDWMKISTLEDGKTIMKISIETTTRKRELKNVKVDRIFGKNPEKRDKNA